jgi:hypothetical protein
MIHNLRLHDTTTLAISFNVSTEVGKCFCMVRLEEKDNDGRPKCFVEDYEVLGQILRTGNRWHKANDNEPVMIEGIKRIGNAVREICDNNGWNLWSF